ncbi:NUDIX domain-containing protein [Legionella jordanis]|uniref:ADP-ribose pyrophosphatase n=1 Tax=Legionella jordanis TaxID=456 RepID=A0A0W0VCI5_9GAMM|nr:NUDIX domain-containing protein [Legionella jordanis]KTD17845.1 NUDIX hydrolase [Legionella jordanis]RMX02455.1 NUDIX domain-containing protein [Legionella jordanis]RMX21702.1 NUDIX domain-containing protein [Legionella jordanis]VEH11218.1 NUDIX hydrolase [Legionella jordanis]
MANQVKCISKEKKYEGYLQIYQYDLTVPSFDHEKEHFCIKGREVVHNADSVLVLIYVPDMDSFLFCQEFRLGVFFNEAQHDPFILEFVSGTIDKHSNPEKTAIKEVHEETGLKIDALEQIALVYKSPGISTEKCYLFYSEFKGQPLTGLHGLDGEEEIMTTCISRSRVYQLMDEMKIVDATTLLALNWFRCNKEPVNLNKS